MIELSSADQFAAGHARFDQSPALTALTDYQLVAGAWR
jgi:hypothetical protein